MKRFEHNTAVAWMEDRIEAYLDGELEEAERASFERHLAGDQAWEAELFLAGKIRNGLQALPQPVCPPHVMHAVLAEVAQLEQRSWRHRLKGWADRWWAAFWQPSLAMALLLAVVVTATLVGRSPAPASMPAQADLEAAAVQEALAEAKWTLAYLSEVGRETGKAVRHDVLEERVVAPMQHALGSILVEHPKTQY